VALIQEHVNRRHALVAAMCYFYFGEILKFRGTLRGIDGGSARALRGDGRAVGGTRGEKMNREGRAVRGGVPREMEKVVVMAVEWWGRKVGIGVDKCLVLLFFLVAVGSLALCVHINLCTYKAVYM
jgi:hypothetical protein